MRKEIWARALWRVWHSFAHSYPAVPSPQDKEAARAFYTSQIRLFPCEDCKPFLPQEFAQDPIGPALESRDALAQWTFRFHNRVNKRLGKPLAKWEDVKAFYQGDDAQCRPDATCGCDDPAAPACRMPDLAWMWLIFAALIGLLLGWAACARFASPAFVSASVARNE